MPEVDVLEFVSSAEIGLITNRTVLPILLVLKQRGRYFGELRQETGRPDPKAFTTALRRLEAEGLLTRKEEASKYRVFYEITAAGMELADAIEPLALWIVRPSGLKQPSNCPA